MKRQCEHCQFFDYTDVSKGEGACRAEPPRHIVHPSGPSINPAAISMGITTFWPTVKYTDWCGMFTSNFPTVKE